MFFVENVQIKYHIQLAEIIVCSNKNKNKHEHKHEHKYQTHAYYMLSHIL